ncbi:salivary protein Tsal1-like [Musca autumnalis]|uniref:salivary protein Tsal1-like n=1 Tax=Musca autumnalis TaxID=221902 RepID=UPI003CEFEEAB
MRILTSLLVFLVVFALAITINACSITLPDDIQGFAPVLLIKNNPITGDYQLFKPTGKTTEIPEGASLYLACTGSKNVITSLNVTTLALQCSTGQFMDANNNAYALKDIVCKSIPSSTLRLTSNGCSQNRGAIFEAGYTVDRVFYGPTLEICYDNDTERTFYTHNVINGAAIDYNIKESTRRSFSAEGMKLTTTKTNTYYTQNNQVARFENYFGSDQTYIDSTNYLARGHLTPDADFIFGYEQLSTYYYVNVAPEFQPINAGNWLRVEEFGRSVAAMYGKDLETYNGYFGQLQLPTVNGDLVDIYLDDAKQIEVPEYYFKVLLNRAEDAAIVFITVNNPYVADGASREICESVCDEANLQHDNFPTLSKGYTFCCRLEDFKLSFDGLPLDVEAEHLLVRKV